MQDEFMHAPRISVSLANTATKESGVWSDGGTSLSEKSGLRQLQRSRRKKIDANDFRIFIPVISVCSLLFGALCCKRGNFLLKFFHKDPDMAAVADGMVDLNRQRENSPAVLIAIFSEREDRQQVVGSVLEIEVEGGESDPRNHRYVENIVRHIRARHQSLRLLKTFDIAPGRFHECVPVLLERSPCATETPGIGIQNRVRRVHGVEHPHSLRLLAEAVEHRTPCLGICLGFQMQALHFGARLMQLAAPRHGVETRLQLSPGALSGPAGIDMTIGLYHSWAVDPASWPEELKLLGSDAEGIPMALEHRSLPLRGFQFHPESVLSPRGGELLAAFLREVERIRRSAEAARSRAH